MLEYAFSAYKWISADIVCVGVDYVNQINSIKVILDVCGGAAGSSQWHPCLCYVMPVSSTMFFRPSLALIVTL